jgi:hypothetical protein
LLADAVHMPPAFSQSALLVILEKSFMLLPGGLAAGELDDPDGLLVVVPPVVPGDVVVPLPDGGLLAPGEVDEPPLPGLVWAAAMAGVTAMRPTMSMTRSLFIATSSRCRSCRQADAWGTRSQEQ